jgi:hypothetical protein
LEFYEENFFIWILEPMDVKTIPHWHITYNYSCFSRTYSLILYLHIFCTIIFRDILEVGISKCGKIMRSM